MRWPGDDLTRPNVIDRRRDSRPQPARSPSAVAPTALAASQRRQPLELLVLKVPNAINVNKRRRRLVRIEKVRVRIPLAPPQKSSSALSFKVTSGVT